MLKTKILVFYLRKSSLRENCKKWRLGDQTSRNKTKEILPVYLRKRAGSIHKNQNNNFGGPEVLVV